MSTAESIWKNLLARFKQDDAPHYRNYVEIPVCTCGKCECNAAQSWESLQQRCRVTKFLMGLNESFESSRRQILMLKPLPSIEDVFNLITQDERQRVVKPSSKPHLKNNTVANVMSSTPGSGAVNLDLNIMNVDQVNNLIQQLQRQVHPSASIPPAHRASITDGGYMDPQSSTGTIPCLSTNLRYEYQTLTFQR
ncbi:hypothetical protein Bca52824_035528 [Brassica carinata]|uniref:Uncharacterized protein n=1 Tax=Brassica carinata TaxID=52824 RepID=A0A8X7V2U3_BRACI|nr:hypothetical protein Bca52824_035528 [Brassica carinata]